MRETDNTFPQHEGPTIGLDFKTKIYTVGDLRAKAFIWDTAGGERFHAISRPYFRGTLLMNTQAATLFCFAST
jgi:GTPase SAR1 family protein